MKQRHQLHRQCPIPILYTYIIYTSNKLTLYKTESLVSILGSDCGALIG